jgi:hypothetical protein
MSFLLVRPFASTEKVSSAVSVAEVLLLLLLLIENIIGYSIRMNSSLARPLESLITPLAAQSDANGLNHLCLLTCFCVQ